MKYIFILFIIFISSCDEVETKFNYCGKINNLRIDDDGEYHFNTDYNSFSDIRSYQILINRGNVKEPLLYIKEMRCPVGKICLDYSDTTWINAENYTFIPYKIILPFNYKIETFND